jgi:predicted metalloprotease with PDZ domain
VPYTLDELLATLDRICPNDWRSFFARRIEAVTPHAPLGGVEASGWRLAWSDTATGYFGAIERALDRIDLLHTIGVRINPKTGAFIDVFDGASAARAGLAPGMKLVAVDGRRWSKDVLLDALRAAARAKRPVELLVENGEYLRTLRVDVPQGLRYPWLERRPERPDRLGSILAPRGAAAVDGR